MKKIVFALLLAGSLGIASCKSNQSSEGESVDTTATDTATAVIDTAAMPTDTVPGVTDTIPK